MKSTRALLLAVAIVAAPLLSLPARAQDNDFYRGKTVTLVVGYSAGGGYDQYARMLARHFGRHIPGNPTIVVQNMPGAASFTAVRYLSTAGPKDGTAIAMFDPGLILESLSAPERFNVKFSDYQWLGGMSREVTFCYAWHATGIKTWNDMMGRKEFLLGLTAKGSAVYANAASLRQIFNAPIRQIAGYPGSNEQRLALERGEIEGAVRLVERDPARLDRQWQDRAAGALCAAAPARHAGQHPLRQRSRHDAGAEGHSRHPQCTGPAGQAVHCRQGSAARAGAGVGARRWPRP